MRKLIFFNIAPSVGDRRKYRQVVDLFGIHHATINRALRWFRKTRTDDSRPEKERSLTVGYVTFILMIIDY